MSKSLELIFRNEEGKRKTITIMEAKIDKLSGNIESLTRVLASR